MSFLGTESESARDFFNLVWRDLAFLIACLVICVVGSFVFPKTTKSKVTADGLLATIRKMVVAAMSALVPGQIQSFFRLQKRSVPLPCPHIRSNAAHALDVSGFPPDRTRESFVLAIRDAQSHGAWDATLGLVKEMQHEGFEIPAGVAARLFKKGGNAVEACASLRHLKEAGVVMEITMYNAALVICVEAGDTRRLHKLHRELRMATRGPNTDTFCVMLKGCLDAGDLPAAKEIVQEMLTVGLGPREFSYNTLINAAVSSGEFQIAWDVIDSMKKAGVPVDGYTVSIMMKTLRQRNSRPLYGRHARHSLVPPQESRRVFEFLDESGVDFCSDEVLLTTVLDPCVWHKELARIERILELYFMSGLQPTVVVYPSLIKAAKCIDRMDLVWKLWREVVEQRELTPNHILFGCMLDALVRSDCADEAVELFQEWKTTVPPTTVIYATLVKGFIKTKQADRALQMLAEMRAEGVPRNTVLYNMILGVHATQGALDKVQDMMCDMASDGCAPDVITYSIAVKSHCMIGDIDAARGVLRQAQQNSIVLDAIVYNSIVYGSHKHHRDDLADELVEDMLFYGITPNGFTLSLVVKMYGRQGRLDRAFEVVSKLSCQPACSDLRVAAALLGECTRNGDIDRAQPIFQALLAMGGPDAFTFWHLITCCVRRGEHLRAQAFLEGWLMPQGQPRGAANDGCVNRLLRALQGRQLSEALRLLEELRKESQIFDKKFKNMRPSLVVEQ